MKSPIIKVIILGFVLFSACSIETTLTPVDEEQQLAQLGKDIEESAKKKACLRWDN